MDIIGYLMGKIKHDDDNRVVEQKDDAEPILCEVGTQETLQHSIIIDPLQPNGKKGMVFSLYSFQKQKNSNDRYRFFYRFGARREYVCSVFDNQKDDVITFVEQKIREGMEKEDIKKSCRERFSLRKRKIKDSPSPSTEKARLKDFSFSSKRNGRIKLYYRFEKNLEFVSWCKDIPSERIGILKECRELVATGKEKDFIITFLRSKYQRQYDKNSKKSESEVLTWSPSAELLYNGNPTRITPSQLNMICTLHASHENPFTCADYVLQNLPSASVLAISYICTNYDSIDFSALVSQGMQVAEKGRGFDGD